MLTYVIKAWLTVQYLDSYVYALEYFLIHIDLMKTRTNIIYFLYQNHTGFSEREHILYYIHAF